MAESNLIAGRFEQLELIGAGGMGLVYKGLDTHTGDFVAIKELKPEVFKQDSEMIQRFEREGEALRKLNHPSIVKVLASAHEGENHYIILEYVKGGSLRDKLDESPQLPIAQVLEIALDLADALTRAHRLNIIHRDIKPANVLMADDGTPRLTDFGVARIGDSSQMTKTGVVMGTLAYLPPEALAGERIDQRADIWAYGVMLYEMVAGRRPFEGENSGAIMAGILQKEAPDVWQFRDKEDFTAAGFLAGLIYWMLEKDREKRPNSFRMIGAMLENLISGKEMPPLSFQGTAKDDAERTIAPSEAAAILRDYGSKAYKSGDLEHAPTTPKGTAIPAKTETAPSHSDWAVKSKRQLKHPPRIFLSYRRDDSVAITGRLYDRLSNAFGDAYVFKDMEDIPVGSDFKQIIEESIQSSDVVLAIIGRKWLNAANDAGRRLEDPADFVRLEVESALRNSHSLVIPVLVDNAEMPEERLLPPSMKNLLYRNAAPVRNDPDFNRDVEWLVQQIQNSFEIEKPKVSQKNLSIGVVTGIVLLLAIIIVFALLNVPNTAAIRVEPIAAGDYMVLVAEPEFITGTKRNVQDNIVRDLEANLSSVTFSRTHVRAYPAVIHSADEAQRIAEQYDAHLILWGNYDDERIEITIQLGDLAIVPNMQFPREDVERFANASYHMSNEREETLAFGIMAAMNVIHTMANDPIEVARNVLIYQRIEAASAVIQGTGVNTYYQRFVALYARDTEASLAEVSTAINEVEPHAYLYIARSLAYQSLNRVEEAERDIRIARQLAANPNWITPEISLVNSVVFIQEDYAAGLAIFPNNFETAAAGNWLYPAYRGSLRYYVGDIEGARSDIALALSLNPRLSLPYSIATALAFRDGDILEARAIFDDMVIRFPDARLTERVMKITYNPSVGESVPIRYLSAFASLVPGDWESIIEDTQAIIDSGFQNPDVYLIKGFAHCNLEQYSEAEEAYSAGIDIEPTFVMLYGLRSEVRFRQFNLLGAQQDVDFVLRSGQNQFVALAPSLMTGDYSCKDFFTFDFASLVEATEEANE
jgi:serine/threonine protein kinase/tetratricopeptide (TPR) repeat protein